MNSILFAVGLQGAAGALPSKVHAAKLAIHDQNQAIARSEITCSPGM